MNETHNQTDNDKTTSESSEMAAIREENRLLRNLVAELSIANAAYRERDKGNR